MSCLCVGFLTRRPNLPRVRGGLGLKGVGFFLAWSGLRAGRPRSQRSACWERERLARMEAEMPCSATPRASTPEKNPTPLSPLGSPPLREGNRARVRFPLRAGGTLMRGSSVFLVIVNFAHEIGKCPCAVFSTQRATTRVAPTETRRHQPCRGRSCACPSTNRVGGQPQGLPLRRRGDTNLSRSQSSQKRVCPITPSLRFPLQAGGTEPTRPTRFPSRSGGNLKEGGNCKLCPCDWY